VLPPTTVSLPPSAVALAIGTVEPPSMTNVLPPIMLTSPSVLALWITKEPSPADCDAPIIEAIAEPTAPCCAELIATSAEVNGIVVAPFTTTPPPVEGSEYVVPSTVTGDPPGTRDGEAREGAAEMDDSTDSRLESGTVVAPFMTTLEDAKENVTGPAEPETVTGFPEERVFVPITAGEVGAGSEAGGTTTEDFGGEPLEVSGSLGAVDGSTGGESELDGGSCGAELGDCLTGGGTVVVGWTAGGVVLGGPTGGKVGEGEALTGGVVLCCSDTAVGVDAGGGTVGLKPCKAPWVFVKEYGGS
jgi:hypothetical protein